MIVLSMEKKIAVISALVEDNSIRSIERMTGVHRDTTMRLLLSAGDHRGQLLNERIRHLPCRIVQVDEICTYVGKKEAHISHGESSEEICDQYMLVAMDS